MPRQFTAYEPDAIDCNAMWSAICHDFGLIPTITTEYGRDMVQVVVKCRPVGGSEANVVQVQALVQRPLKTAKSLYVMQYAALLDCWHQLDRGVLAAATRPVERGWDGRPKVPATAKRR